VAARSDGVLEYWSTAPSPNCTRVAGRDAEGAAAAAGRQPAKSPLLQNSITPLLHHSALFPLVTRHSFIVILFTMKKLVVLGTLLPLILLTSSIAAAFDLGKVHNLVVFGDSLSDNGNTFAAVGLPKPPYYKGRWTNGLNWVDDFTTIAGLPPRMLTSKTGERTLQSAVPLLRC
jgi:hypothetical protein